MSDETRSYHSPLRDQRTQQTRHRILDAATQLLAHGAAALTIPAVAREAGVAVPTVYRHFASKEELEEGVATHVRELAGVGTQGDLVGMDGMVQRMRRAWTHIGALPPATLVVLLGSISRELLTGQRGDRLDHTRQLLAPDLDGVLPEDRERFEKVIAAWYSTPGAVGFKRLGLPDDEAAELAEWAGRTLLAGLRRVEPPEPD